MPYKNPEKQRAAVREAQRRRRAGERKARRETLPELAELRYQTARDVLELLSSQVQAVESDADLGTVERARCIGYLAGLLLRAVEQGDLEDRLAQLEETVLANRRNRRWS